MVGVYRSKKLADRSLALLCRNKMEDGEPDALASGSKRAVIIQYFWRRSAGTFSNVRAGGDVRRR